MFNDIVFFLTMRNETNIDPNEKDEGNCQDYVVS